MQHRASQFIRLLMIVAICISSGAHWVLLQSVAWTTMLVEYSQNASFGAAVEKTFDGEHPCPLCKAVSKGRSEEEKQQPELKTDLKFKALLPLVCKLSPPQGVPAVFFETVSFPLKTFFPVPTQPPRAA